MMMAAAQCQQDSEMVVAVVCLQAQRVAGLPASVQHIHLTCRLLQHPPHPQHHPLLDHLDDAGADDNHQASLRASASASASVSGRGSGDFHSQVLLLHCTPSSSSLNALLTVSLSHHNPGHPHHQQHLQVHLGTELPGVLTYALTGAAAGALLTLVLHRKLLPLQTPSTATSCCLPLPACCRQRRRPLGTTNKSHIQQQQQQQHGIQYDSGDESSAGFIVIEKEIRRPPSDTTAHQGDNGSQSQDMKLDQQELDSRVEDEFLAMLHLSDNTTTCVDLDLDLHLYLDELVREAEAELANASTTHLPNTAADASPPL